MTLRVDLVGSFLRPDALKDAFAQHARGELDDGGLRAAQDTAIRELVEQQTAHGLPVVGDGEFRRKNFNQSFSLVAGMGPWYAILDDVMVTISDDPANPKRERGNETRTPVTERLRLIRNIPLEEYAFVAEVSDRPATVTLISVDRVTQRLNAEESTAVYPTTDAFVDDVVTVEREMVAGLHAAGCRIVHIDAPSYTSYVDADMTAGMRSRGEDPEALFARSLAADNAVIAGFDDMTFSIHLCRGNGRGRFHRQGSYDAIAERMFTTLKHDRFLLEYDDERSGDFTPLRFLPKGKTVVLGLISTKTPVVERADELLRRIEEAAKVVPIEQIAISPQCGFASGMSGNPISSEAQWRKIDVMMEVAESVWGPVSTWARG